MRVYTRDRVSPSRHSRAQSGAFSNFQALATPDTGADPARTAIGRVMLACALKRYIRRGEREPGRCQQTSQLFTHTHEPLRIGAINSAKIGIGVRMFECGEDG